MSHYRKCVGCAVELQYEHLQGVVKEKLTKVLDVTGPSGNWPDRQWCGDCWAKESLARKESQDRIYAKNKELAKLGIKIRIEKIKQFWSKARTRAKSVFFILFIFVMLWLTKIYGEKNEGTLFDAWFASLREIFYR